MEKLAQRTIILMRHAKSDWSTNLDDIDRPLNLRGERDALKMANYLKTKLPDRVKVMASTARRSRDTATTLVRVLPHATMVSEDLLYLASTRTLFNLIEDNESEECLILVGHNPGLEELVGYIDPDLGSRGRSGKTFPTCAVYAYLVGNGETIGSAGQPLHRPESRLGRPPGNQQGKGDWDFRFLFHQRPKDLD